ncbi:FadR/GntR family transcriptional regulator [Agrobacterium tumefaciens]|uniref:FadR/GntR family transcriptional regulator n=1 Tax=Agrobacterium tumefaciens TaxID=358 RepID=UPI00023A5699|nr:FadR family transcriptional regulator [Agrobacterium tumefaciens 5A]
MGGLSDWLADAKPINRKNAAEVVFEDIRSAITSGQLVVGTRLPSEAHLAERYGVSRPIVREALRSLQTLGLTQTRTGSGTYVMTVTPPAELSYGAYSARDLIEARPFIEVPAAGWAALRRTDAQLETLLELCDRMEAEERPHPWVLLDGQFHCAIAEASSNALFAKVVADAREALSQQSEMVNLMAGRRVASNLEHRRIVEAIRRGSSPDAREAMELHLGQVKQVVTTIIGEDRARHP